VASSLVEERGPESTNSRAPAQKMMAASSSIAVFDGVPPGDAVDFVREHYSPRAVETPWQRRYVIHFAAG